MAGYMEGWSLGFYKDLPTPTIGATSLLNDELRELEREIERTLRVLDDETYPVDDLFNDNGRFDEAKIFIEGDLIFEVQKIIKRKLRERPNRPAISWSAAYQKELFRFEGEIRGINYSSSKLMESASPISEEIRRHLRRLEKGSKLSSFPHTDALMVMDSIWNAPKMQLTAKDQACISKLGNSKLEPTGPKLEKVKRGLQGFVNGVEILAFPDTGAATNMISTAYAQKMQLTAKDQACTFKLGNSKLVESKGIVSMDWAFAEDPTKVSKISCHVLPNCTYDLVLGNPFLKATQTLTKYSRRLTPCVFRLPAIAHMGFLNAEGNYFRGTIGRKNTVFAVPDTGAERNIMDLEYALRHGYEIRRKGRRKRGCLLFADGTSQSTVGRVKTTWTFETGERVPINFEVLETCSADVILGDNFLWDHNVFEKHTGSFTESYPGCQYPVKKQWLDLAPFTILSKWQEKASNMTSKARSHLTEGLFGKGNGPYVTSAEFVNCETNRRNEWNYKYGFRGEKASDAEKKVEEERRREYKRRWIAPVECSRTSSGPEEPNAPGMTVTDGADTPLPRIHRNIPFEPSSRNANGGVDRESRRNSF